MQKKLIALAVAGLASTAAFAQSNVTVYGVADGTFDIVKSSSAAAAGNDVGTTTRVTSNSSYLGFKGMEDLGNGLKAVFQYEAGVGIDSGAALSTNRDSYVGVAGGFGTVVLGNLTGPTRALGASLDVFSGATGIGANSALLGKLGNNLLNANDANSNIGANGAVACGRSSTCTSVFDSRWKNAVAYVSPTVSGFTGTFAYVANENKTNDGKQGVASVQAVLPNGAGLGGAAQAGQFNTKGYDAGVTYNNGPIMAGLTYNWATLGDTSDTKAKDLRLGGSYNFGVASLRLMYDRVKVNDNAGDTKQTVWGIGGTYNVTANGKLVAQYYKAGDLKANGGTAPESGAKLFALGYEHSLSKRTLLKATYSRLSNNDNAAYDFGVGATGFSANGATLSGVQVGLRHSF